MHDLKYFRIVRAIYRSPAAGSGARNHTQATGRQTVSRKFFYIHGYHCHIDVPKGSSQLKQRRQHNPTKWILGTSIPSVKELAQPGMLCQSPLTHLSCSNKCEEGCRKGLCRNRKTYPATNFRSIIGSGNVFKQEPSWNNISRRASRTQSSQHYVTNEIKELAYHGYDKCSVSLIDRWCSIERMVDEICHIPGK